MTRVSLLVAAVVLWVAALSSQTQRSAAAEFRTLMDRPGLDAALSWLAGLGTGQKSRLGFDEKEFLVPVRSIAACASTRRRGPQAPCRCAC